MLEYGDVFPMDFSVETGVECREEKIVRVGRLLLCFYSFVNRLYVISPQHSVPVPRS